MKCMISCYIYMTINFVNFSTYSKMILLKDTIALFISIESSHVSADVPESLSCCWVKRYRKRPGTLTTVPEMSATHSFHLLRHCTVDTGLGSLTWCPQEQVKEWVEHQLQRNGETQSHYRVSQSCWFQTLPWPNHTNQSIFAALGITS